MGNKDFPVQYNYKNSAWQKKDKTKMKNLMTIRINGKKVLFFVTIIDLQLPRNESSFDYMNSSQYWGSSILPDLMKNTNTMMELKGSSANAS
jgi:hypothetical protein